MHKKKFRTYIRDHARYPQSTQEDSAKGKKYIEGRDVTLPDFIRALRPNEVAAVYLAYLFAPARKKKNEDVYKTWWKTWREIEKRCEYVLELKTGLRTDQKDDRDAIVETALEMIRKGGRADASRENGKRSRGRPVPDFTPQEWKDAEAVYFDSRLTVKEKQARMADMPISWYRYYDKLRNEK